MISADNDVFCRVEAGRNSADNKERAVDEAKTYAELGIPGPALPALVHGEHATRAGPRRAA